MSKELLAVHIMQDVPGIAGTCVDFRFIDKSKGHRNTQFGPILNYDKFKTIRYEYDVDEEYVAEDVGNKITEMLCDD